VERHGDAERDIIGALDPQFAGYDFDIANATATAAANPVDQALRIALPRLKAVTVADFKWTPRDGGREPVPCPLGEGVVDFEKLAATLAKANFLGPISLHVDYQPSDEVSAIQRDLEFLRKRIATAYASSAA
jgi:sugar phosphate isomerase/epimerase